MHIGFTGTRHGMTAWQYHKVEELVAEFARQHAPLTAHHGDCIGADAEFHAIAMNHGARLVVHPPVDESHRAFVKTGNEWRPALTHLARNRAIVTESAVMIATPFESTPQARGGTWFTIDYTMKMGKPLAIVMPNGAVVFEGAPWPDR